MNVEEFKHFDRQQKLYKLLDEVAINWRLTGSRAICNPPPTDTDEDYIILVDQGKEDMFEDFGFHMNTDKDLYTELPKFYAYRKGIFNLIVTSDIAFYWRFVDATLEAKVRNLQDKNDRIDFFQKKLYGEETEIPF